MYKHAYIIVCIRSSMFISVYGKTQHEVSGMAQQVKCFPSKIDLWNPHKYRKRDLTPHVYPHTLYTNAVIINKKQ